MSQNAVSQSPVPDHTLPEETLPEETLPEETLPEETLPEGSADEESADEGSLAEEASEEPADGGRVRAPRGVGDLEREGEVAADYLEGLLDIADLDGDIDMDVEGERAMVAIEADGLDVLVGADGKVLDALQELTRLAVLRETGERSRLMLDIAGFRAARRAELDALGRATAEEVRSSGEPRTLEAMTPFERKVVHDAVATAGLRSESEGEEPRRRVVVLPA